MRCRSIFVLLSEVLNYTLYFRTAGVSITAQINRVLLFSSLLVFSWNSETHVFL